MGCVLGAGTVPALERALVPVWGRGGRGPALGRAALVRAGVVRVCARVGCGWRWRRGGLCGAGGRGAGALARGGGGKAGVEGLLALGCAGGCWRLVLSWCLYYWCWVRDGADLSWWCWLCAWSVARRLGVLGLAVL